MRELALSSAKHGLVDFEGEPGIKELEVLDSDLHFYPIPLNRSVLLSSDW
jgi:hypothetical protein